MKYIITQHTSKVFFRACLNEKESTRKKEFVHLRGRTGMRTVLHGVTQHQVSILYEENIYEFYIELI